MEKLRLIILKSILTSCLMVGTLGIATAKPSYYCSVSGCYSNDEARDITVNKKVNAAKSELKKYAVARANGAKKNAIAHSNKKFAEAKQYTNQKHDKNNARINTLGERLAKLDDTQQLLKKAILESVERIPDRLLEDETINKSIKAYVQKLFEQKRAKLEKQIMEKYGIQEQE